MKINDTVLAAFLVSLGLFSAAQAAQYVGSLSETDKVQLYAAKDDAATAVPTDPSIVSAAGPVQGSQKLV